MTLEELKASGWVQQPGGEWSKDYESANILRLSQGGAGKIGVQADGAGSPAELERDSGDGAVGEIPIHKGLGRRFLVRVKAFRGRLLDEDNLCEKYHVDLCRYAGALPSDAPGTAKIEVSQEKVGPKEQERVEIEIYEVV